MQLPTAYRRYRVWLFIIIAGGGASLLTIGGSPATAEKPGTEPLSFATRVESAHKQGDEKFFWFHTRAAALPGFGKDGQPAVVMTLQKHLVADDHYTGLYVLRTDDLGKTWTGPTEVPELAWRSAPGGVTIAVIDVTPGWHAPTRKLIAIGAKILYTATGDHASLYKLPRSYETSYATYDPQADAWTPWRELEVPETDGKFFRIGCGCSQWLVQPDGTLLVPVQFQPAEGGDWRVTILHCRFDGREMTYLSHGDELGLQGGRGLTEPSLAFFRGKYYLTLRNDARAYVTTSDDGLHFEPIRPWTFDDGQDLGSYNTQAHWLVHSDGLFLSYTRRGADNDHIARHRAPLFLAQVDPGRQVVLQATERIVLPERGVPMGNFGAVAIAPDESWITVGENMWNYGSYHPTSKGAEGAVLVGRIHWSRPNQY